MPTVQWNTEQWGSRTNWNQFGDGWSSEWGGAEVQWCGSLLPRIHSFIPCDTILEIAPGFGRWTQFLKNYCNNLIVIDLVEKCIEACKVRFASCSNKISYFVNDGRSLDMVADDSVDLVFSFDSLVHADPSVIRAYISQLPRILKKNGVAYLHHSNLGKYSHYQWITRVPKLKGVLGRIGIVERDLHNRELMMSARIFEQMTKEYGLSCISQEMVNWRTKAALIDCFSVVTRDDSQFSGRNIVRRNNSFMKEARQLAALSSLYGRERFRPPL